VDSGRLGKNISPKIPNGIPVGPSDQQSVSNWDGDEWKERIVLMMKTHCQPCSEVCPRKLSFIAVIITPANMLPIWPMAVKIAVRLAISKGLLISHQSHVVPAVQLTHYQEPRM
jgi:hypothetical protein